MALDREPPAPSSNVVPLVDDRRAHRRARVDLPVLVETASRSATARCIDVGGGGIALRTDVPLGDDEIVSIYLELPIGVAIETKAAVLRRAGDLIALRFVDPPREAVIAVRSFCRISSTSTPSLATG